MVNGEAKSFGNFLRHSRPGSLSDEEGDHNVECFMLCSYVHHACSLLLQGFLHEEELRKVALTCHFASEVIFLCLD